MSIVGDHKPYLTTIEAGRIAGVTPQKIRTLIELGKLPAVDISTTNNRPRWSIRLVDLESFLTPPIVAKADAKQQATSRRRRIDANVPKVF
jgi:hypothetical protein